MMATDGGDVRGGDAGIMRERAAGVGRRTSGAWMFAFYIFVPVLVFFVLPILFYRVPLRVLLATYAVYVGGHAVFVSVAASLVWLILAAGLVVWPQRGPGATARTWTPQALWTAFLGFSVLGGVAAILHALYVMPSGFEEFVHLAAFAPTAGFVLGLYVLRSDGYASGSAALKLLVTVLMLADLGAALLVPVLFSKLMPAAVSGLAILYGLSAMRMPGRRQLAVGVLLVAFLVASYPVKLVLRQAVFNGPYIRSSLGANPFLPMRADVHQALSGVGVVDRSVRPGFDLWNQGFRFHLQAGRIPLFVVFAFERVVNRINRLSDLAYVVSTTPSRIPYAGGATYVPLEWKLVPRLLWPTRPSDNAGQYYGHRYDLITPEDTVGSYNLPIITEGWMNWGWWGVIGSALFVGLVLRLMWRYGIGESGAPGNVLLGVVVVGTAAVTESDLSLVMGGVIQAFILYTVVEFLIRTWGARAAAARRVRIPIAAGGSPPVKHQEASR